MSYRYGTEWSRKIVRSIIRYRFCPTTVCVRTLGPSSNLSARLQTILLGVSFLLWHLQCSTLFLHQWLAWNTAKATEETNCNHPVLDTRESNPANQSNMMMSATIRLEQRRAALLSRKLAWRSLFLCCAMVLWHLQRFATISRDLTKSPNNEYWALPEETTQMTPTLSQVADRETTYHAIGRATEDGEWSPQVDTTYDPVVIDFISVGSLIKPENQAAQLQTFAQHEVVRNFFGVTELNDTDATCHTEFSLDQWQAMRNFCSSTAGQSNVAALLRTRLFWPKKHTGWMCAQKRPIDGFRLALEHYQTTKEPLPSYLLIIDDDTYVNMPAITQMCQQHYPITEPHVIAGCRFTWPRKLEFSFPTGGFGSILTRAALERIMRPLYCSNNNNNNNEKDEFSQLACWRLEQNHVGEKQFFREGMSVGELMIRYAAELPFTRVHEWNHTGYCFHSDHTLGYFFDFYHVMLPDGSLNGKAMSDRLRRQSGYEYMEGQQECQHEKEKCTSSARICHYVTPQQMQELYSVESSNAVRSIK